jgi:hypothetical protein
MTICTDPGAVFLLYLDFDGVLHPADVWHDAERGPTLASHLRHHRLFEHAQLLADLIAIRPDIRIVLATSWVRVYGLDAALSVLPKTLRVRVVDSVYDPKRHGPAFAQVARGYQILEHVQRARPAAWIALDDDANG